MTISQNMIYVGFIAEKKYKGCSPKSVKTTTLIPSVTGVCVFRRVIPCGSLPSVARSASRGEVIQHVITDFWRKGTAFI